MHDCVIELWKTDWACFPFDLVRSDLISFINDDISSDNFFWQVTLRRLGSSFEIRTHKERIACFVMNRKVFITSWPRDLRRCPRTKSLSQCHGWRIFWITPDLVSQPSILQSNPMKYLSLTELVFLPALGVILWRDRVEFAWVAAHRSHPQRWFPLLVRRHY